jgi:hypothetical protein
VTASAALDERLVLVVGANRSGTTWLQQLLLAHPDVAGLERTETWLFVTLGGLWDNLNDPDGRGLRAHVPLERGIAALRGFADAALDQVARDRPDAARVLERTPGHAMHLPLIRNLYPGARVVHLLRDGRDVVQSVLELDFATHDPAAAARQWRETVEAVHAELGRFAHGTEVRYEALVADPVGRTRDLLGWMGLSVDEETTGELRRRAGERVSRYNTTGDVGTGKWRRLDRRSLDAIEAEAGGLLRSLGYADEV